MMTFARWRVGPELLLNGVNAVKTNPVRDSDIYEGVDFVQVRRFSELLWVNRLRLLQGKPVRGLRQVDVASTTDQEKPAFDDGPQGCRPSTDTTSQQSLTDPPPPQPAMGDAHQVVSHAGSAIGWLKLVLPEIDRLEMDHLLTDLKQVQKRIEDLETAIAQRCGNSDEAILLSTIPGVAAFTATSLACRIGRIERFPRSHSLANYWGLDSCRRNSGENNQRLGSITKAGSGMEVRWLLAQATHRGASSGARAGGDYRAGTADGDDTGAAPCRYGCHDGDALFDTSWRG